MLKIASKFTAATYSNVLILRKVFLGSSCPLCYPFLYGLRCVARWSRRPCRDGFPSARLTWGCWRLNHRREIGHKPGRRSGPPRRLEPRAKPAALWAPSQRGTSPCVPAAPLRLAERSSGKCASLEGSDPPTAPSPSPCKEALQRVAANPTQVETYLNLPQLRYQRKI